MLIRMPKKPASLPETSDLVIDDWKDCEEDEGDCIPPVPDIRYDLNQLKILEAIPTSLTYSDVGVVADETAEKAESEIQPIKTKGPTQADPKHETPTHRPNTRSVLLPPGQVGSISSKNPPPVSPNLKEELSKGIQPMIKPTQQKVSDNSCPIIIFHDIFRSQIEWQLFAADLAYNIRKRTIVVDLRNHGTSPFISAKCGLGESLVDVRNLLRELKLPASQVTAMGHKLSGWVLMAYCLLYPYKFRNLIVIEANPNVNPISSKDLANLKTALNLIQVPRRGIALRTARFEVGQFLEDFISNSKLRSYVVQNLVVEKILGKAEKWELRRTDILDSLSSFNKFPDFLRLFTFDKPTLFIASLKSKFIKKEDQAEIMKLFPQAEFVYLKKASSNPHIDEFDNLLTQVAAFLNKDGVKLSSKMSF